MQFSVLAHVHRRNILYSTCFDAHSSRHEFSDRHGAQNTFSKKTNVEFSTEFLDADLRFEDMMMFAAVMTMMMMLMMLMAFQLAALCKYTDGGCVLRARHTYIIIVHVFNELDLSYFRLMLSVNNASVTRPVNNVATLYIYIRYAKERRFY